MLIFSPSVVASSNLEAQEEAVFIATAAMAGIPANANLYCAT
jgi:hypothetical protein